MPATRTAIRFPRRRKGAALLVILGLIFVMSLVLSAFLGLVHQQLRLKALYEDNDDLRVHAYGALEATLSVLGMFIEKDKGLFSPTQGWENPLQFASLDEHTVVLEKDVNLELDWPSEEDRDVREARLAAMDENERARAEINAQTDPRDIFEYPPLPFPDGVKISIELSDETALVPLTNAYAEVLLEIFKHGGISESQAKGLVDCLLDWADSDDSERVNGAEQNHYDRLTPRVAVPNRALRSFDELYHIKDFALTLYNPDGTPNEIWKLFRSLTTLHSHSKINLNTASPKLLEILAERGEFRASQVEDHRNGSDGVWGTRDDEIIQKLEEVNITASPPPSSEDPSVQGSGGISHLLGIQCELLRLRITASRGDSKFILSVLLKASGSKDNAASFTFSKLQENRAIE